MAANTEGYISDMESGNRQSMSASSAGPGKAGSIGTPQTAGSRDDPNPAQPHAATYPAYTTVVPTAQPKEPLADIREHTRCMFSCAIAFGIIGVIAGVCCLFAFSGGSLGVGTCLIMFSIVAAIVAVVASQKQHPTMMLVVGIFLVLLSILAVGYALYLIYVIYVSVQAWLTFLNQDAEYIHNKFPETYIERTQYLKYPQSRGFGIGGGATVQVVLQQLGVPNGPLPPHPTASGASAVRMAEIYRDRGLLCWFSKANILFFKKWPVDCDYYTSPEGQTPTITKRRGRLSRPEQMQLLYYAVYTGSAIASTGYFFVWTFVVALALIFCAVVGCCLFPIAGTHGIRAYEKRR